MKIESANDIEQLLGTLIPNQPSDQLDEKMDSLFSGCRIDEAILTQDETQFASVQTERRFGWGALLTSAIAAMLAGILIGNFAATDTERISFDQLVSGNPVGSETTKVKFNTNAFELLHGHSQDVEFKDCKTCHKGEIDDENEAFKGWFYGDKHFFHSHKLTKNFACATCHRPVKPNGKKPAEIFNHQQFYNKQNKMLDCKVCHVLDSKPS